MIWKSLLVKWFFLACAVAFIATLNPRGNPGQEDAQRLDLAAVRSNVTVEPVNPFITTVGLISAEMSPRPVKHHNESMHPSRSPSPIRSRVVDQIDVNNAEADSFTQLPGIGVVLAQRIVDFRNVHGPFDDLTTLLRIKGIGPKRFAKIQPRLSLSAP